MTKVKNYVQVLLAAYREACRRMRISLDMVSVLEVVRR